MKLVTKIELIYKPRQDGTGIQGTQTMNLMTQVEMIYKPRYRWPRRVVIRLHRANHKLFFWEKCPMCRLERRRGRKWQFQQQP